MIPSGELVDLHSLLEAVAGALVAGVGITTAFAIAVAGLARSSQAWRGGRTLSGSLGGVVGVIGLGVALTGVIVGLVIVAGDSPLG
jgi:hypothetical protein